jgi:hypothetical protein
LTVYNYQIFTYVYVEIGTLYVTPLSEEVLDKIEMTTVLWRTGNHPLPISKIVRVTGVKRI